MAATMTAAVLYGKEDLRLEQLAMPLPDDGEIVLKVGAALTCGTDLKVFRRGYHAAMLAPPIPFGHEVAGVVSAVGRGRKAPACGRPRGCLELGTVRRVFLVHEGPRKSVRGSAVQ